MSKSSVWIAAGLKPLAMTVNGGSVIASRGEAIQRPHHFEGAQRLRKSSVPVIASRGEAIQYPLFFWIASLFHSPQ
jgi:hypothetical protein